MSTRAERISPIELILFFDDRSSNRLAGGDYRIAIIIADPLKVLGLEFDILAACWIGPSDQITRVEQLPGPEIEVAFDHLEIVGVGVSHPRGIGLF